MRLAFYAVTGMVIIMIGLSSMTYYSQSEIPNSGMVAVLILVVSVVWGGYVTYKGIFNGMNELLEGVWDEPIESQKEEEDKSIENGRSVSGLIKISIVVTMMLFLANFSLLGIEAPQQPFHPLTFMEYWQLAEFYIVEIGQFMLALFSTFVILTLWASVYLRSKEIENDPGVKETTE